MGVYIGGIPNIITSQIQGPCPSGFHVPTIYEWTRVINILRRMNRDNNSGYLYLKLPNAYYRNYAGVASNGSIYTVGGYWSCTPKWDNTNNAYVFRRNPNGGGRYNAGRCLGLYIRPFKDTPVVPDSSRTNIFSNSQGSIKWDQTNGLISLGNTYGNWITIADKNLGATQVFNNSDTKSQDNCGKFFQWGNNYGFDWSGTLTTSSTRVDASSYGPGNYYSSSTFIKGSSSSSAYWDSSNNPNLWGGVTGALPSELGAGSWGTSAIKGIYKGNTKVRPSELNWVLYTETDLKNNNLGLLTAQTTSRQGQYSRTLASISNDGNGNYYYQTSSRKPVCLRLRNNYPTLMSIPSGKTNRKIKVVYDYLAVTNGTSQTMCGRYNRDSSYMSCMVGEGTANRGLATVNTIYTAEIIMDIAANTESGTIYLKSDGSKVRDFGPNTMPTATSGGYYENDCWLGYGTDTASNPVRLGNIHIYYADI